LTSELPTTSAMLTSSLLCCADGELTYSAQSECLGKVT